MINHQKANTADELRAAVNRHPRGTWITYFEGQTWDVGSSEIGKAALRLSDEGRLVLCQKRIGSDGVFVYYGVVV